MSVASVSGFQNLSEVEPVPASVSRIQPQKDLNRSKKDNKEVIENSKEASQKNKMGPASLLFRQTKAVSSPSSSGGLRQMILSSLVPGNTKASVVPTSFFQLVLFHFYHSLLVFFHIIVSLYIMVSRQYYRIKNTGLALVYHHHRTPQLICQDIKGLAKAPNHVAVVLNLKENEEGGGVEGLMANIGDIASWSIGAGVKQLTVYERTGKLNKLHEQTYKAINRTLKSYYGEAIPSIRLTTPHDNVSYPESLPVEPLLNISLISKDDGRPFMVELTRDFARKAAVGEFDPAKITVDAIDSLATKLVITEPDLVVLFGPRLDLDGFPPWQVRLSEIYYAKYNNSVTYSVFLRGLRRYSKCKINVGR
ncbi:Decaprenyl diphosphate synthase-like protein [Dipodascopsis uninucleata]